MPVLRSRKLQRRVPLLLFVHLEHQFYSTTLAWVRDLVRCGLKLMLDGTFVEFIPSYNLLIHLVRPSPLLPELLPTILNNLSTPPSSSPNNGPALVLSILTTIFNVLQPTSNLRSTVFQNILKIISTHGLYEVLSPQLKNLDRWFAEWNSSNEEMRSIFVTVANIAEEASDDECVCLALRPHSLIDR